MEIYSFEDGHELQIPTAISINMVCVDEFLHFQEDSEKIYDFPYCEFPFEHCCEYGGFNVSTWNYLIFYDNALLAC
jgi:hypothetical protein